MGGGVGEREALDLDEGFEQVLIPRVGVGFVNTRIRRGCRPSCALDRSVAAAGTRWGKGTEMRTCIALLLVLVLALAVPAAAQLPTAEQRAYDALAQAVARAERDTSLANVDAVWASMEAAERTYRESYYKEVRSAVQAAERAAGEAEQAAAGPGTWFERTNACFHASERYYQASNRVTSLIYESRFIPAGVAVQAMDQVRDRLAAAQERARAACASIGPPPEPRRGRVAAGAEPLLVRGAGGRGPATVWAHHRPT